MSRASFARLGLLLAPAQLVAAEGNDLLGIVGDAWGPYEGGAITKDASNVVEAYGTDDGRVCITYTLSSDSVDDSCETHSATGPNQCGIHIHAGYSCADGEVGGHYFGAGGTDPWGLIRYSGGYPGVTWSMGKVKGTVCAEIDATIDTALHRTVVVHNAAATKIACGVLHRRTGGTARLIVPQLKAYPCEGYSNCIWDGEKYGGAVSARMNEQGQVCLNYKLLGGDPGCGSGPATGTPNSCGIHIHAGTTCEAASGVLGHYWNNAVLSSDPWQTATYDSTKDEVCVDMGHELSEAAGRAVVVHDKAGHRVSCGLLEQPAAKTTRRGMRYSTALKNYPCTGSIGDYPNCVWGSNTYGGGVTASFRRPGKVCLRWDFGKGNGDEGCKAGASTAGNSCGIHIHSGNTCEDASLAGGHYWDNTGADPWSSITYRRRRGYKCLDIGHVPIEGKAIVVHDKDGHRVACGLLQRMPRPSPRVPRVLEELESGSEPLEKLESGSEPEE